MAKYHEVGRFSEDLLPDLESALYHLKKAASGGVTDALYTLAHIHLQQPHDDFKELTVEVCVCVCVWVCVYVCVWEREREREREMRRDREGWREDERVWVDL